MSPIRPPFMQAPNRGRPDMGDPRIPVSLKREAERLVVQAAKEYVENALHGDGTATQAGQVRGRLVDSVRILKSLEGE